MEWIARGLSPNTYVNVMAQYYPAGKVSSTEYVQVNRRITDHEFRAAVAAAHAAGVHRLDPRFPTRYGLQAPA